MKSVLQDWVMNLGLRHQGTLLTAVRGCDTAPKEDASKALARCFRDAILNPHCGDAAKAQTFIEHVDRKELFKRFWAFKRNCDHYPHHYVMHLMHAAEIVAYKHPDPQVGEYWRCFYVMLATGMHVNPETEAELDERAIHQDLEDRALQAAWDAQFQLEPGTVAAHTCPICKRVDLRGLEPEGVCYECLTGEIERSAGMRRVDVSV